MKELKAKKLLSVLLTLCLLISLAPAVMTAFAANSFTIDSGIKAASDDMEEQISGGEGLGNMDPNSSDIEIGVQSPGDDNTETQYEGFRFADLMIPQGATITNAYIQFTVDEAKNGNPFNVNIVAEDVDNAVTFNGGDTHGTTVAFDLSNRYTNFATSSSVNWTLADDGSADWATEGDAAELQRTPDLTVLVQSVVDRAGWSYGNAISFLMLGTGCRTAISYDKDPSQAAVLHVEYTHDGVLDQNAPEGLTGIAATTADNTDGAIGGTTTAMEYKVTGADDAAYVPCMDGTTTGLVPGSYNVRYAATDSLNASTATTVTVPAYVAVSYEATNVTFQYGSDETSMNFTWYSNDMASAQSVVQIAPAADMDGDTFPADTAQTFTGTIDDSNGFKSNEVYVTGLDPMTVYVYRLGDGTQFDAYSTFETQDASNYNAILVGDPQIGSGGHLHGDEGWKQTVTQALTNFPDTSFILSAGDQVNNSTDEEQYLSFFAPDELLSTPLVPAIGNHDANALYAKHYNSPNESATYGTTSAGGDYWFTYGKTLYMVLNSNNQSSATHEAFMEEAIGLAGSDIQWKIVMFHHSIYSSASHSDDGDILLRRDGLYPVFDKLDIDVVVAGHDHVYTRTYQMEGGVAQNGLESSVVNPVGTLYITANSGSGSKYYDFLSLDGPYAAARWQGYTPSYSNIEVTDTTFTITTYITGSNDIIDAYTITKDQSGAPAGLAGIEPTSSVNDDGKITGTTTAMEYKLSTETTWTACSDTETTGLVPGVYDVRLGGGNPSVSTIVTVPVFGGEIQDQSAPAGLVAVAPTSADNNDGKITGTTTDMEYKPADSSEWTACPGTEITGLEPGSYDVRYPAKPGFNASPVVTVTISMYVTPGSYAIVSSIHTSLDDIEERPDGSLDYDSSDLEIVDENDWNNQQLGLRFTGLSIPKGAFIVDSYIQFCVDENDKNSTDFNVSIFADDTANSAPFENVDGTVSSRDKTDRSILWHDIPSWTVTHAAGPDQRTPDLSPLVQDIVDRDGWAEGNAISFILTGTGQRSAESYEGAGFHTEQIPTMYLTYVYNDVVLARNALANKLASGMYTNASAASAQTVIDLVDSAIIGGTSTSNEAALLTAIANAENNLMLINQATICVAPNTILGDDRSIVFRVSVEQLQDVSVMEGFVTIADSKFEITDISLVNAVGNVIFTVNPDYYGDQMTAYFSLAKVPGFTDAAQMDVVDITIRLKDGETATSLAAALDSLTMYYANAEDHTSAEVYSQITGDGTATTQLWVPSDIVGDFNGNSIVTGADLAIAITYFGADRSDADWFESGAWRIDLNDDGTIDIEDLTIEAWIAAGEPALTV